MSADYEKRSDNAVSHEKCCKPTPIDKSFLYGL